MNLCYAKLEFSLFICKSIEPFLLKFQAQRPLVPFLYQEMLGVLRLSLDAFVRSSVIESSVTDGNLTKIDLDKEENLKSLQNIDIGFGVNSRLKKLNPLQQLKFRGNCQKFYVNFCKKLVERSCLAFPLTELLSCFSPRLMRQPNSISKLTKFLEILYESRYISAETADAVKRQYLSLVESNDFSTACDLFQFQDRLDDFFYKNVGSKDNMQDLWTVTKIVLTISHGNARVESGFSVNKAFLCPNLKEATLRAQRIVYDAVKSAGGPSKTMITNEMLKSVSLARKRYQVTQVTASVKMLLLVLFALVYCFCYLLIAFVNCSLLC